MNPKIILVSIFSFYVFLLFGQPRHDCPDFSCKKTKFLVGLSNKTLEKAAKKHRILEIVVSNGEDITSIILFDKNGNLIERSHGLNWTTNTYFRFQYDSLNRIISSSYLNTSCYGNTSCKEKYHYDINGNSTKQLLTGIAPIYGIDSMSYKKPYRVQVGKSIRRIACYDQGILTKIQYYKWRSNELEREIIINQKDSIKRIKELKLIDKIDNELPIKIFDDLAWRTDISSSITSLPYSEEILSDSANNQWKFEYNEKGLRCKESLIETDKTKSYYYSTEEVIIEYLFY